MQEKLINCHCCCRCNELTFAYDKAMEAFKCLLEAQEKFQTGRDRSFENPAHHNDFLRARIVLQQQVDAIEKDSAKGLRNSTARLKDDLDFDRIRCEFEVSIMKLNVLGSLELLEAITSLRLSAKEQLDATAHMLPYLQKALEESYAKAHNAF